MKLKSFISLFLCLFLLSPILHAKKLKAKASGEGKSEQEACYRAHGEIRRAMEKACKDEKGVDYDSLELEDCERKLKGKIYKATYESSFHCKKE